MTGMVTYAGLDVHARSTHALPAGRPGRRAASGRHARWLYGQHPTGGAKPVPRERKPAARNRALGHPTPASSDWQRRHRARRPALPTTPTARHTDAIKHAHLTNTTTYQSQSRRRKATYRLPDTTTISALENQKPQCAEKPG
jgi:hypothetical protein